MYEIVYTNNRLASTKEDIKDILTSILPLRASIVIPLLTKKRYILEVNTLFTSSPYSTSKLLSTLKVSTSRFPSYFSLPSRTSSLSANNSASPSYSSPYSLSFNSILIYSYIDATKTNTTIAF
jgi:hypothetical protein